MILYCLRNLVLPTFDVHKRVVSNMNDIKVETSQKKTALDLYVLQLIAPYPSLSWYGFWMY